MQCCLPFALMPRNFNRATMVYKSASTKDMYDACDPQCF
jgi:hypothetical protein